MRTIIAILFCASSLFAADASRRAPGFSLIDVRQQLHDLADYRGKVVILEFMQVSCPHCAAFNSVLQKVEQKYGDRVAVLAIVNPPSDVPKVTAYLITNKVTHPILFDCGQVAYSYLRTTSFDTPHVYLIDANGGIRDDFGYTPTTIDVFEGNGLFPRLDAILGKK